ncbi:LOW QUALITY PROTEIN: protein PML-like [Leptosomus discolor]
MCQFASRSLGQYATGAQMDDLVPPQRAAWLGISDWKGHELSRVGREELEDTVAKDSSRGLLEDDFQFILCEGCQQESPDLKLLTCLHTLCLSCLNINRSIGQCPLCRMAIWQSGGITDIDNLLFTSLQATLKVYKKIVDGVDLVCDNCKKAGEFWCSECKEFLCTKCFEAHQRYLKRESHETKRVTDIRAGSAKDFLESIRKTGNLSCFNPAHESQTVSFYCKKCEKALCCLCMLLDSQHAPFCDIRSETQRRQEELGTMSQELKQKRSGFEATYAALEGEATRLEEAEREMRELIRQHVEQLGQQELARELQRVAGVLRRMEASERLVEKMRLYATEREVMDMQPFIKNSLEQLQQLQLLVASDQAQPGNFAECRARLQALVERVMGHPGTSAPEHDFLSEEKTTLILDLEPPGEHCQPHGSLPAGLPAHYQPCAPVSDPSGGRGHRCPDQQGNISPTQPTPPACLRQRVEEAEEDSESAHGDTVPLHRSIQDTLASLQEDFGVWARSNVQQADKLLKTGNHLLQAQRRANRHLVSVTQEIQAMSRSLATIASAVGPLLQPVAIPRDLPATDVDWLSLPSHVLELFPPSTPQNREPLVPAAATAPSPSRPPPATAPASPACSEPSSLASKGECPKSRDPTKTKKGGKPSTRLQKRRKKSPPPTLQRGKKSKMCLSRSPVKVMKIEDNDDGWNQTVPQQPSCSDQPGTSHLLSPMTLAKEDILLEDMPDGNGGLHDSGNCVLFQDSSLLDDLSNILDESISFPISSQNTMDSRQGSLVFFDMRILRGVSVDGKDTPEGTLEKLDVEENESIQMTVVDGEKIFPVLIQPVKYLSSLMAKNTVCEIGLRNLLCHLNTVHRPILGGFGLWSLSFPTLLKALTVMNKNEEFSSVVYGFLDILPLIKEEIPKTDNYKLKNLASTYLWWHFSDSSTMENDSIMKYLCEVLDVNLVKKRRLILSQASLESFISLQPLLDEKLHQPSAQTLALHNIGLSELWSCYQHNPEKGLQEVCRLINAHQHRSKKKVRSLKKIKVYFQRQEQSPENQKTQQAAISQEP